MAVKERTLAGLSIATISEELRALICADDAVRLGSALDELVDAAEETIGADVGMIAGRRDRLDRIARSLAELERHPLGGFALGYLRRADHDLARARTRILGELADRRRAEEADGVRDRVLAALSSPRRPRDVAEELGVERSQVSREIRALLERHLIERIPPPPGAADDGRAHWYAQAHATSAYLIAS